MKTSNLFLLAVVTSFAMDSALAIGPGNAPGRSSGASAGSSAGASAGTSGSTGSAGQSRAGNPGVGTATQTQAHDQTQLHTDLQIRDQLHTPGTALADPSLLPAGTPHGIHTPGTGLTTPAVPATE